MGTSNLERSKAGVFIIKYPFRPHKCQACWETFTDPKQTLEHLASSHKADGTEFQCSKCSVRKDTLQGMAIHFGLCN